MELLVLTIALCWPNNSTYLGYVCVFESGGFDCEKMVLPDKPPAQKLQALAVKATLFHLATISVIRTCAVLPNKFPQVNRLLWI